MTLGIKQSAKYCACNLRLLSVPCKCLILSFTYADFLGSKGLSYIMHVVYSYFHSPLNRGISVLTLCPHAPRLSSGAVSIIIISFLALTCFLFAVSDRRSHKIAFTFTQKVAVKKKCVQSKKKKIVSVIKMFVWSLIHSSLSFGTFCFLQVTNGKHFLSL